jgi:hypothetical protein
MLYTEEGFNNICKAEYHRLDEFSNYLEESEAECKFKVPFGFDVYCSCPLRVYITKNCRI